MSSSSWRNVRLGEIAEVRWGDTSTTKASYVASGFLAYSATGPDGFLAHFDHDGPGIVVSAIGAQCGKVWYANGRWSCIKNTIFVKGKAGLADTRFLFFLASTPDFWPRRGAAQPFISQGDARGIEVRLPPLEVQRRIASILGAYDDLIEVNRRRIAVLEEMARRLFEEWFVAGRVPASVSREMSMADWPTVTVGDVMRFVRGRSYRSVDLADAGGLPFVNLKCIQRDGGFRRDGVKRYVGEFKDEQLLRSGDIVIAVTDMTQDRRIVGQAARIPRSNEPIAVMSMDLVKVVPGDSIDSYYCYHWLRYSGFARTAAQHANGANVLHLSPSAMTGLPMTLPPLSVQAAFGQSVAALVDHGEGLSVASDRLAASRDLLLPRLISGELPVSAAEREFEAVA